MNKQCGLPVIYLGNSVYINLFKKCSRLRISVIIHSTMKTTIDVARQTRKFYLQANLLLRNFRHCSDDVKSALFRHTLLISIVVSCGLIRRNLA